jgi:hypothetical protein
VFILSIRWSFGFSCRHHFHKLSRSTQSLQVCLAHAFPRKTRCSFSHAACLCVKTMELAVWNSLPPLTSHYRDRLASASGVRLVFCDFRDTLQTRFRVVCLFDDRPVGDLRYMIGARSSPRDTFYEIRLQYQVRTLFRKTKMFLFIHSSCRASPQHNFRPIILNPIRFVFISSKPNFSYYRN